MIARLARFLMRSPVGDFNCAAQDSPSWDERAAVGADLAVALPWTGRIRVADLGAGNERLREVLTERLDVPLLYEPYDLRPQQASTRQLDVEQELPEGPFDIAFCLGLMEYLRDPHDFLHRLSTVCRYAVPSYVIADGAERLSARQRRARGPDGLCDAVRQPVRRPRTNVRPRRGGDRDRSPAAGLEGQPARRHRQ